MLEAEQHVEEDRLFLQKAAVRRRLAVMESELENHRQRCEGAQLSEAQEHRIKEAFFKLDLALSQDDMTMIDEAKRNAQSVFVEITSLLSIQHTADNPELAGMDFTGIKPVEEPQKVEEK